MACHGFEELTGDYITAAHTTELNLLPFDSLTCNGCSALELQNHLGIGRIMHTLICMELPVLASGSSLAVLRESLTCQSSLLFLHIKCDLTVNILFYTRGTIHIDVNSETFQIPRIGTTHTGQICIRY